MAIEKAYQEAVSSKVDAVLFDLYSDNNKGGQKKLRNLDKYNWPMSGLEALKLTFDGWKIHTFGMYKREIQLKHI